MKVSIQLKLFLLSIVLIGGSFLLANVFLSSRMETEVSTDVRDTMLAEARLGARIAATTPGTMQDLATWSGLAQELGSACATRVTIIRADGVVVGESGVAIDQVRVLENHLDRPEFKTAMVEGAASSARYSKTLGVDELYVAVAFRRDNVTSGVVRVARPMSAVVASIGRTRSILATAALIALVCVGITTLVAASAVAGVVKKLTEAVKRMTAGELATKTGVTSADEFGELGAAIDALAHTAWTTVSQLQSQLYTAQARAGGYAPPRSR